MIIPDCQWAKKVFSDDHKLFALLIPTKKRVSDVNDGNRYRPVHKVTVVELASNKAGAPDPLSLI